MSKLKKGNNRILVACIAVVFILLSYVKFYTTQVSFSNDPTVAIVKTENIQWPSNTYKIDTETLSYNWYDDYGFKIIYADEMGHIMQRVHSVIIALWWIMMIFLVVMTINSAIKKMEILV